MAKERVIPRTDTAGRWESINPQLAKGEMVFVVDEHNRPAKLKLGYGVDGASPEPAFNELPYALGDYPATLQNGVLVYPWEAGIYGKGYILVSKDAKLFQLSDEVERPFDSQDFDSEASNGWWQPVGGGGFEPIRGKGVEVKPGEMYYYAGAVFKNFGGNTLTFDGTLQSVLSQFRNNLETVAGQLYVGKFDYVNYSPFGEGLVYYNPGDGKHYTCRGRGSYFEVDPMYFSYGIEQGYSTWYEVPGFVSPDSLGGAEKISYKKLAGLLIAGVAQPGKLYELQNYRLQTWNGDQTGVQVAFQPENLLLRVATPTSLDPKGYSMLYPNDIVYYDPFHPLAQDDNSNPDYPQTHTGYIYRRIDTKWNNDFPFDFRSYLFYRYSNPADGQFPTRVPVSPEQGGPSSSGYLFFEHYTYEGGYITNNHWAVPDKNSYPLDYVNYVMLGGYGGGAYGYGEKAQLRNTRVEAGSKLFGMQIDFARLDGLHVHNNGVVEDLLLVYRGLAQRIEVDGGTLGEVKVEQDEGILQDIVLRSGGYIIGCGVGGPARVQNIRCENGAGFYMGGSFFRVDSGSHVCDNVVLDMGSVVPGFFRGSMVHVVASPGVLTEREPTDDDPSTSYYKYVDLPMNSTQLFYFGDKLIAGTLPVDPNANNGNV